MTVRLVSQYDEMEARMRKDELAQAEDAYNQRLRRQVSLAQYCAEEIGSALVSVDINDQVELLAALRLIDNVCADARAFVNEAIDNLKLRTSLSGP